MNRRLAVLGLFCGLSLVGLAAACSNGSSPAGAAADGGADSGGRDGTMTDGAGADSSTADEGARDSASGLDAEATADAEDAAVESGPPPIVLASDVPNPSFLVTDGAYLYWTDFIVTDAGTSLGRVMKMSVTGGAEATLATETGMIPAGLAVDTTSVYWVDDHTMLYAAALDGGATVTLATGVAASSIAADGQYVYVESGLGTGVARVPVDGGSVVTLATPDGGLAPAGIAIDAVNVYWPAPAAGAILAVPKAGGSPVILASNGEAGAGANVSATSYQNVASSGVAVYWNRYPLGAAPPSGAVLAALLDAGLEAGPAVLYDAGPSTPFSVVTDGVNVYFLTSGNTPALMAAPVDGAAAVTLASNQFAAGITGDPGPTIAVDATSVYWLSPPQILKIAK